MAAQHTPGPWSIDNPEAAGDERALRITVSAAGRDARYRQIIATVYAPNEAGTTLGPNARLIAAAPELLAAAKELLSMLHEHMRIATLINVTPWCIAPMSRPIHNITAAIATAQANGGQP